MTILVTGHFSRVPKTDWEKAQAKNAQLRQYNDNLTRQGRFYYDQLQGYRAKFPKSVPYFPKYPRSSQ